MSVTLLIVVLGQCCVCCIRSDVTRCPHLIMQYLDRMCLCGLHAVPWSHIGILMHRLAAEPRATAGLLFAFQCPSGTVLLTPYSMVPDWQVSRVGPVLFYCPKLLCPYYSLLLFLPFSSFCLYSIGWYCGAGVLGLVGYISLSLSLELPTSFNNNNNNNCFPCLSVSVDYLCSYFAAILHLFS